MYHFLCFSQKYRLTNVAPFIVVTNTRKLKTVPTIVQMKRLINYFATASIIYKKPIQAFKIKRNHADLPIMGEGTKKNDSTYKQFSLYTSFY